MKYYQKTMLGITLCAVFLSCTQQPQLTEVKGGRIEIDASWNGAETEANAIFLEYKQAIDSIMTPVIGVSTQNMTSGRPESLLSNLIADVLRDATVPHIGRAADVAVINLGGLRSTLAAGNITFGNVFEILPFENALCILKMKGKDIKELMQGIALNGAGVSNVKMEVKDKEVISLKIGGELVNDNQLYEVATLDYLAEGNDRMTAFLKAEKTNCYPEETIRNIFMQYIQNETAAGRKITSKLDGRITLK